MKRSFQIKAYLEVDLLGLYFFMISHIVLYYKLQSNKLLGMRLKGYKLDIRGHRNNYLMIFPKHTHILSLSLSHTTHTQWVQVSTLISYFPKSKLFLLDFSFMLRNYIF